MAKAGDTLDLITYLLDNDGYGLRYEDAAAFQAAGWSVLFELNKTETALAYQVEPIPEGDDWTLSTAYAENDRVVPAVAPGNFFYICTTAGTSGGSEPTWDTTIGGTTADGTAVWTTYAVQGQHRISYTGPSGLNFLTVRAAKATATEMNVASPGAWNFDLQSYDMDDLGAAINAGIATPGILAAQSQELGTVTSGDSFKSTILTAPADIAQQIFDTLDFTGFAISAGARFGPKDPATNITIDAEFVSESDRTFKFGWDEMPADIITRLADSSEIVVSIDIEFTSPTPSPLVHTTNKYTLTVVWSREGD